MGRDEFHLDIFFRPTYLDIAVVVCLLCERVMNIEQRFCLAYKRFHLKLPNFEGEVLQNI